MVHLKCNCGAAVYYNDTLLCNIVDNEIHYCPPKGKTEIVDYLCTICKTLLVKSPASGFLYCPNWHTHPPLSIPTNKDLSTDTYSLKNSFNLPGKRKTLKTSVKKGEGLECALMKAFDFIQRGNTEGYTGIEFKYADCYFVIAKLKDKA